MPDVTAGRNAALALLGLALSLAVPALGQELRTERIVLDPRAEAASVRSSVTGAEAVSYLLTAEAGHRLRAELRSENPALYLNVRLPGAGDTVHAGPTDGNLFEGPVPAAGDVRLSVFLGGEAARRGERAEFMLRIALAGMTEPAVAAAAPAPPPAAPPPAAATVPAEPLPWTITGLPRGQRLNLPAGPSRRDRVVARLPGGETLRNRGCRQVEEERWCEVERAGDGAAGWVAARYLQPAEPPPSASPTPAGATSRPFDATGLLPCAMVRGLPSRDCRFGIERQGDGAAVLEVLGHNGVTRRITFVRGVPSSSDGPVELTYERFGALFLIRVGEERFEVSEPLVIGG
ncbi:MAG TPA: SH3 domain-containing protein [Falsiroseomonas sp.]|nr:SH3 domain-containing protein [Falsiroseomonas sp.]